MWLNLDHLIMIIVFVQMVIFKNMITIFVQYVIRFVEPALALVVFVQVVKQHNLEF